MQIQLKILHDKVKRVYLIVTKYDGIKLATVLLSSS